MKEEEQIKDKKFKKWEKKYGDKALKKYAIENDMLKFYIRYVECGKRSANITIYSLVLFAVALMFLAAGALLDTGFLLTAWGFTAMGLFEVQERTTTDLWRNRYMEDILYEAQFASIRKCLSTFVDGLRKAVKKNNANH